MNARHSRRLGPRLPAALCLVAIVLAQPPTRAAQTSAPDVAAGPQTRLETLAPARPGLDAVPLPGLDELEPLVASQLRDARRAFERATANVDVSSKDLAEAYGALARVFHAYEFFETAEPAYANAARLSSGDARWPHLLGYLYQQTGRLAESAARLAAARRARPDDYGASARLGEVYLGLNRLNDAREEFMRLLPTYPAAAHSGLGEVALREQRFEEAVEHFRAALERVPQATSLHYGLAMAFRGLGRLGEARSHLQQRGAGSVKVVDPLVDDLQPLIRGERLLVVQGKRAYDAGQYRDAADAFRRAIAAAPGSVPAHVNLSLALSQLGDSTGALEHLRAAFELAPGDAAVSAALIGGLVRLGREDQAITVMTRARSVAPDDEETLVSLAILLAHRERYREAVALLEEGHRRFPDRAPTATTLARLLASSPDRSLRDGQRALDLAMAVYASSRTPADGETIALALGELDRCGEALDWMRRAVAQSERDGDTVEAARLKAETSRYQVPSCRAPGH
jgi:tetratricopeptide (TPR) repeat protein